MIVCPQHAQLSDFQTIYLYRYRAPLRSHPLLNITSPLMKMTETLTYGETSVVIIGSYELLSNGGRFASSDLPQHEMIGLNFNAPAVQGFHSDFRDFNAEEEGDDMAPIDVPVSMLLNQSESERQFWSMQKTQKQIFKRHQLVDEDIEYLDINEQKRQLEAAVQALQNDETLKTKLREEYIDEMISRQEEIGSFEFFEGTVKPLENYPVNDPVVLFYRKEKQEDLALKPFNPEADCEYLRKAMKGLGTDEDAIIAVLSTRCNSQRLSLKQTYKTMYGRDLMEDFKGELSGDFQKCVEALMYLPEEYDAYSIKEAIYGLGTDEVALIEILFGRTNKQLQLIQDVYGGVVSPTRQVKDTKLENDITDDTSGDFKRLLVSAIQGNRDMLSREALSQAVEDIEANGKHTGLFRVNFEKLVDVHKCRRDAKALYQAGQAQWGTDEETFNKIFSKRNFYELRIIWREYVRLTQKDLLNAVNDETSGSYDKALRAICKQKIPVHRPAQLHILYNAREIKMQTIVVLNVRYRPMFFAEQLKNAMFGVGTDEQTVIRIVISRSEIDLKQVKECFLQIAHRTLYDCIDSETSGDFKKLLLAIVKPGPDTSELVPVGGSMTPYAPFSCQ